MFISGRKQCLAAWEDCPVSSYYFFQLWCWLRFFKMTLRGCVGSDGLWEAETLSETETLPKQQQSVLNYLLFIRHTPSFLLLGFSLALYIKNEWLWLAFRGVSTFLLLAGVIQEQYTAETCIAMPLPDGIQLRDAITIINCLGCTLLVYDVSRDPQLSYILVFN